jgi:hypothetical protein
MGFAEVVAVSLQRSPQMGELSCTFHRFAMFVRDGTLEPKIRDARIAVGLRAGD